MSIDTSAYDNVFNDLHENADDLLKKSVIDNLEKIRAQHPHTASNVLKCLPVLKKDKCRLIDIIAVSFIMNEGVYLKYDLNDKEEDKSATTSTKTSTIESEIDEDFDSMLSAFDQTLKT
jgi:hypothetical protein